MARVPAAERTIAILRHLAQQARPVSAAAIARDLGLPRSSTYHLLETLAAGRFVTHLPEERRWALGVGAVELGSAYLRQEPLERLARPLLHRLAHHADLPAHLAIIDGRDIVYLVTERPRWSVPLVVDVGVRLPAHLTASGRALLAEQTRAQVHATFPPGVPLPLRTGVGPTSHAALGRILAATRRQGHASEDGEVDPALASVAVTAHDHAGRAVAAVTLTFPASAHDADARTRLAGLAAATADRLTERLGGGAPAPHGARV